MNAFPILIPILEIPEMPYRHSIFIAAILTFGFIAQSQAKSLTPIYLDPGYVSTSLIKLPFSGNAFAFDSSMNLYTVNNNDNGTGNVNVLQFSASSNYGTQTTYSSFSTLASTVSGLEFQGNQLLISQGNSGGDSGSISSVGAGTSTLIANFATFRPTGIDARNGFLFTARQQSDLDFGNVFRLNSDQSFSTVISNIPLRGIAVDAASNIFVSTRDTDFGKFIANSVYEFSVVNGYSLVAPTLIATFSGSKLNELSFGTNGALYALVNSNEIVQLTSVPEPESYAMIVLGLFIISCAARRRQNSDKLKNDSLH